MLQRVVWNLKLNVFSANDGQFRVYCIALSNVNQPAAILVVRDERRLVMIVLRICIRERPLQVLESALNVERHFSIWTLQIRFFLL